MSVSIEMPWTSELNLIDLWNEWQEENPRGSRHAFTDYLRRLVIDPSAVDHIGWCDACGYLVHDDRTRTGAGDQVCDSCLNDYHSCDDCGELYGSDDDWTDVDGEAVCGSCINHYRWCDDCEVYYHEDSDSHHHDGSGCCESPQQEFTIRNDGEEPLANDTRAVIQLPAGLISEEGMAQIRHYLRWTGHRAISYEVSNVGPEWQSKTGNFTKRLSRQAYKKYRESLPPEILSEIGNIARAHSMATDTEIEVTRDLNQSPGYFYNADSCWWGSYSESRCALKTNGGFGMRSLDKDGDVSGRAWVMPLRKDAAGKLVPTFSTLTPDAFAVFNGYGKLGGYTAPRLLAHMAGWTYRKIIFTCSDMYVNPGSYLVAPEDIAQDYTDGRLNVTAGTHSDLFEEERG